MLEILFVLSFSILLLSGGWWIFYMLFDSLESIEGIGVVLVERLLSVFFIALFFMLIFSSMIVSFTTFYRSRELKWLFSLPITHSSIFNIKYLETIFLTSWAFFILIAPLIGAYGMHKNLGIYFFIAVILIFIPFVFLAGSIGIIITLLLAKYFNWKKARMYLLICIALVAIFLMVKFRGIYTTFSSSNDLTFMLTNIMPYFNFSQFPLFPSYWLTENILSFSIGDKSNFIFYFLLIFSNVLFAILISRYIAKKIYYKTWANLESTSLKKIHFNKFSKFYDYILSVFSRPIRALIEKDSLIFFREPSLWLQFFIFFGLLAVYFSNIQNLSYHMVEGKWKNLIASLNFSATILTLSSLCIRFIFPQMSLEGQRYWIVGLSPIKFRKILFQKFWVSTIFCLIITESLITLSNVMLEVPSYVLGIFSILTFLSCFALVGLSCGLGAKFINIKEENISQIVSGFAGTLNLILSLIYVSFIVISLSAPLHLYFTQRITQSMLKEYLTIGAVLVLLVSIIFCILPLYAGIKSLEKQEF